jgi:hypothetical protein
VVIPSAVIRADDNDRRGPDWPPNYYDFGGITPVARVGVATVEATGTVVAARIPPIAIAIVVSVRGARGKIDVHMDADLGTGSARQPDDQRGCNEQDRR